VLRFLHDPAIEPTNNRGERALRPAVIVRKLSYGSNNERGAEAFAAFSSVIQTAAKNRDCSIVDALQNLFQSKSRKGPPKTHPPPD
jgi:transposase